MEKVKIIGKLKVTQKYYFKKGEIIRNITKVGFYDKVRKIFCSDKNNPSNFFKITENEKDWKPGEIYCTSIKKVVEKKKKEKKETPPTPPKSKSKQEKLEEMTKAELRKYAKENYDLELANNLNKQKLIKEIIEKTSEEEKDTSPEDENNNNENEGEEDAE